MIGWQIYFLPALAGVILNIGSINFKKWIQKLLNHVQKGPWFVSTHVERTEFKIFWVHVLTVLGNT